MHVLQSTQINWKYILIITFSGLVVGVSLTGYHLRQNKPEMNEITPDFSFTVNPLTQKMATGDTVSYDTHVNFLNGFSSTNIDLWIGGLPSGITATYAPDPLSHQGVSVLTVAGDGTEKPGIYTFILGATSEGIIHKQSATLVITAEPEFKINISPTTQTVAAGEAVSYEITVTSINKFSDAITLSVSGIPNGVSAFFTPNLAVPNTNPVLTIKTSKATPQGQYPLLIKGASGTKVHDAEAFLNITAPGSAWTISSMGTTGSKINTVIVGSGRNDGISRVYAGTVETGRVFEFSWKGTQWSKPIDIGGSPANKEIHNMTIGPGRNDGISRIYAASIDGNLYELTYNNSGWIQNTVGVPSKAAFHAVVGNGRNDGINRLYAVRDTSIWEYTWTGTSWNSIFIGKVLQGVAHGIVMGDGRGNGKNHFYVASTGSGVYEATFSGGLWSLIKMGDSGDARNVGIGIGRNDGIQHVYTALLDGGRIREFTWNDNNWKFVELTDHLGAQLVHAYILGGRGDNIQRVYTSAGNGNVYEFTWNGSSWETYTLGGGKDYMYGFSFGQGRNDGIVRLYGGSFNTHLYEYTWSVP